MNEAMSGTIEQGNPTPEYNIVSREDGLWPGRNCSRRRKSPLDEFAVPDKPCSPKTALPAILVSTTVESNYATNEAELSCALVVQHQDFTTASA